jgi:hypothetical protein
MRPFALRQRRLIFRSVSAAGSTLLACIFEAIPKSPPGPFGTTLPPPCQLFVATRGTIHMRNPLPSPTSELPICDQASAPLQDLSIPPARSAQLDSKQRSLPLRVARFSFAPRCARNNHLFTSAPDHRSRSATSRQAHCPAFRPLLDLLSQLPLRGAARDLRSGSGLTANRKPDVVQTRLQVAVFRVGTVATGTASTFGRSFAPCYGSNLLTLRLRSLCSWATWILHAAQLRSFRGICLARSLPAVSFPLRARILFTDPGLLAGSSRRETRLRSGLRSSSRTLWVTASAPGSKLPARLTRLGSRFLIAPSRSAPEFMSLTGHDTGQRSW